MVNVENVVNVGMWSMWLMWSMCAVAVEGAKVARNDTFLVALMPSRIVIFWAHIAMAEIG